MRFYESSDFFLRVIVFDFVLKSDSVKISFRIIPMFHIGLESYYKNVLAEVNSCDAVLYEGFQSNKWSISNEIGSYRSIAKRLNLKAQRDSTPLNKITAKIIHADLDVASFDTAWKELGFIEKIKFRFLLPIQLLLLRFFITKRKLAKTFLHSDGKLDLELFNKDKKSSLDHLMFNQREKIVFNKIDEFINHKGKYEKCIGIMYGAKHMNTFARYLINQGGFKLRYGRFIKVFDL